MAGCSRVEARDPSPHHLLYNALAWVWVGACRAVGIDVESCLLVPVLNVVAGAAALALFYALLTTWWFYTLEGPGMVTMAMSTALFSLGLLAGAVWFERKTGFAVPGALESGDMEPGIMPVNDEVFPVAWSAG